MALAVAAPDFASASEQEVLDFANGRLSYISHMLQQPALSLAAKTAYQAAQQGYSQLLDVMGGSFFTTWGTLELDAQQAAYEAEASFQNAEKIAYSEPAFQNQPHGEPSSFKLGAIPWYVWTSAIVLGAGYYGYGPAKQLFKR